MDSPPVSTPPIWALPDVFQDLEADEAAALLGDLTETFRADTAKRLGNLRAALAAADLARIRAEVHSIKGSARQMGAEALAAACQEIEVSSALPPAGRLDYLETCLSTACTAMSSYAAGL